MRFRRVFVIIAFALFFAFVWPTPYRHDRVSSPAFDSGSYSRVEKTNRICEALGLANSESPAWPFAWLGIGAAIGCGVLGVLDSRRRKEEQ
jgi:hypothetical protein